MRDANYRLTVKYNHSRRFLANYVCKEQFEAIKTAEIGVFLWKGKIYQKKPSVFVPFNLYSFRIYGTMKKATSYNMDNI